MALLHSRRGQYPLAGVVLLSGLFAAPGARAGDGVLEINQACAMGVGCFAGDTGGFPVTIALPGSYRLTGNLTGLFEGVPVIAIQAEPVTLDLNGFDVQGSSGAPDPAGVGILGGHRVALRNGSVHYAAGDGVRIGGSSRIDDVHVYGNAGAGVVVAGESTVRGVVATSNGGAGISAGAASVIANCTATANGGGGIELSSGAVTASTATQNTGSGGAFGSGVSFGTNHFAGNGGPDVSGGHASTGNFCEDQSCTTDGRKRYYLTTLVWSVGQHASLLCDAGFHWAALSEIRDSTAIAYDVTRGLRSDFGSGNTAPVSEAGWIRNPIGNDDCGGWVDPLGTGAAASVSATAPNDWTVGSRSCTFNNTHVWCVED